MDQDALIREAVEDTLLQEAEARRFLYADVEKMLRSGFLSQEVSLEGSTIIFRTLYPSEIGDLLLRGTNVGSEIAWKKLHLAHSVHMINGFAIEPIYGGNQAYYVHREWIQNLRQEHIEVLYVYVTSLRYRIDRALKIIDAFCHEGYSRSLWRMVGPPQGKRNTIQRLWVAYNEAEDRYDSDLRQWGHTRAIVGSMSSKGAKSLLEAEKKWGDKKKSRAQRTIEDAVNMIISGDRADQKPLMVTIGGKTYEVPKVHAAQTIAEMEDEMMRAVRGEQDYHDLIVDQYKEFHRKRIENARMERQAAMEALWGASEEGLTGETRMVGYTPEQLAEINPALMAKRPNTKQTAMPPEQERFNQYLDSEVRVGWIGPRGVPEAATKAESKEGDTSLQDKISRRAPQLKP